MKLYKLTVLQVWDIRNNRCLQTLTDKQKHRPEDALTCLMYDPKEKQLLSGSVLPKVCCVLHPVCILPYSPCVACLYT